MTVVLALLLLAPPQQPRDPRAPVNAAGSAIVRGVVVDEASGAPLTDCRVMLALQRTEPGVVRFTAEAFTNRDGRFELLDLPAGAFILTVSPGELRASHLSRTLGQPAPDVPMREPSLTLREGEVKADLRIPLARGLAIEGRLIDEYGEPMADVEVAARTIRDGRMDSGYRAVTTDDRGRFRVFSLAPGTYRVCAEPSSNRVVFPAPPDAKERNRYDRACTADIKLQGPDTPLVDIQAQRVGTFVLTGTVTSASGASVAAARVSLHFHRPDGGFASRPVDYKDGRFTAVGLFPGEYFLMASLPAGPGLFRPDRPPVEGATVPLRVDTADVTGVTVTTMPAGSVSGRIVVDPEARGTMPAGLSVQVRQPGDSPLWVFGQPSSLVAKDGTFTLDGLFGALQPVVGVLPTGWFVKSMRYGSEDVMVQPREFRRGDPRQLEIVISDRSGSVAVRATDDEGKPAAGAALVLLPSGLTLSAATMPYPRPLNQGAGTASGLRPGEYIAVVIRADDMRRLGNPKALEALLKYGQKVTVSGGETVKVDLKMVPFPEER